MQVCGGQKTFTTTKHSVLNAVFEEDLQLDVDLAPEDIVAGVCRIAVVDADISTAVSTDSDRPGLRCARMSRPLSSCPPLYMFSCRSSGFCSYACTELAAASFC